MPSWPGALLGSESSDFPDSLFQMSVSCTGKRVWLYVSHPHPLFLHAPYTTNTKTPAVTIAIIIKITIIITNISRAPFLTRPRSALQFIYNTKYKGAIDMLNQARRDRHTHATNRHYVGQRYDLSAVIKDEADWGNLIFLGSVFQRVGAKKEQDRSVHRTIWYRAYTVYIH